MTDTRTEHVRWTRLGILAGGGDLPLELASAQRERNPFVITLTGFTDRDYSAFDNVELSVGQIGGMTKALKRAGCDAICFAGYVTRPDISGLKMDARGLLMVPKALAAGRKGDDALIRVVVGEFESQGFTVVGANDVLAALAPTIDDGGLGQGSEAHAGDIAKACEIARAIGALDIGQGAIIANGLILAVEAQEGTNAMIDRVAGLSADLRGTRAARAGILAKMPKPIQERRVDLPTIGVDTVERCAAAGLAGIALEAGGALILDREAVANALNDHGMFLTLVEPDDG
ncbi:MAG: UDP-2,3-diacylglucosamine diphosphatase LpxI [Alphaproteobacteria bacterium]|nr:UDP-2,3-diacylglucosamine diphosphatase LpxI [Alphaproteobacteria bacterium]